MRFYQSTTFLFPKHYEWRILLICFAAVHVPLIACIIFQAISGHWEGLTLLVLLLATVAGASLGLLAIHAMLAPIAAATRMLQSVQSGERVTDIPTGGDDLVGRLLGGVARAANESANRIERLTFAAERDPLTGVRNRRGFLDSAKALLDDATPAAFALVDIDHFKRINDQLGHDGGDSILTAFAKSLEDGVRRSDVVGRWGGEEFVILFPNTDMATAHQVMERLRESVAAANNADYGGQPITFSCGMSTLIGFSGLASSSRAADSALYRAKAEGRNRIALAS